MSKHTPGPWGIETETRDSRGSELIVTTADGAETVMRSAYCDGTGTRDWDRAAANARLIAAAPDLLEALEHAERMMGAHSERWEHEGDEESGQHDEDCRACEYDALVEHFRAALAKVRPPGGTP